MMQTEEAKLKSALMAAERECALLGAVVDAAGKLYPLGWARILDTAQLKMSERIAIRDVKVALQQIEEFNKLKEMEA